MRLAVGTLSESRKSTSRKDERTMADAYGDSCAQYATAGAERPQLDSGSTACEGALLTLIW